MTYGRTYVKATVKKIPVGYRGDGRGYVNSDSRETGRSLSESLVGDVDSALHIAYENMKRKG